MTGNVFNNQGQTVHHQQQGTFNAPISNVVHNATVVTELDRLIAHVAAAPGDDRVEVITERLHAAREASIAGNIDVAKSWLELAVSSASGLPVLISGISAVIAALS
ncbi:hypothetical protein [Nocardia tengchongensis]|uniref:hypothetical protein n=1 Tax=Nocardia tengchongensis TaxID=2055889 RepID=UPI003660C3D3